MNATPRENPPIQFKIFSDPNPWEGEKAAPKLHPIGCILLSLFIIAAGAYNPLFTPPAFYTLPLFVVCLLVLFALVRSIPAGIVAAILFLSAHSIGTLTLGDGMPLGTFVLSSIVSIGIGAFLITVCRSKWLLIVPVLAYAAAFAMSRDALLSLLALIPFPAMGILAHNTMGNRSRVSSICLTSFMYGLFVLAGGALLLYRAGVVLSWDFLVDTMSTAREQSIAFLLADETFMTAMQMTFADAGVSADVIIRTYVELIFNVLPALIVCTFNLIGYAAQLMCVRSYRNVGMKELETHTARLFILSAFSGLVFLICGVVSIWPGEMTSFGALCYNLLFILMPGMLIIGVYKLIGDLRQGGSRLWLFILIACALFMPYMLLYCLSFSGALATLTRPLMLRMIAKQGGKFPPDNDNNDGNSNSDH